jgi:hypothetical protein
LDFDETAALGNNARVAVRKNTGADVGTRRRLNFIEGTNVTMTIADDSGSEEIDITINSSGGGGGAPTTAQYVVLALDATLSAERVLVATNNLFATDGGANGNISIKQSFARTFAFMGA